MSVFGRIPDKYASIDQRLDEWARSNGLRWYKEYKDYSVRSLDYPSSDDRVVHLFVEEPVGSRAEVKVARTYKDGTQSMGWNLRDLEVALDEALNQARCWTEDQNAQN